jgi:hypothetical protein
LEGDVPTKLIVGKLNERLPQYSDDWGKHRLDNRADILDFLNEVGSLADSQPLLLYDMSVLGKDMSLLRGFLERTDRSVVCLASYDNIPESMISRFTVFEKTVPYYPAGDPDPEAVLEFLSSNEERTQSDLWKNFIANDPRFYDLYNMFAGNPAWLKILRLFTK